MKNKIVFLTVALILLNLTDVFAQAVRKPSAMRATKQELAQKATTNKSSLPKIESQKEFDEFARVYHQNTPYALPHIMFLIDRRDKNKIYFINSKKYRFHVDFANARYLSLERGEQFTNSNYLTDKRRFILGTLAWQTPVKKWTFEFWEGDTINSEQIKLTYDTINANFFEPVAFKPNSIRQDEASVKLEIARISADEINKNQEYIALNEGRGIGRIHIIDRFDETTEIGYNEILVLKEVPLTLPRVAGLIIAKPSTPLSHVNLLAKGWNIPNAYIKNADQLFKELDGRWIAFETKLDNYSYKLAGKSELDEVEIREKTEGLTLKAPPSNLKVTRIAALRELRRKDSLAYGAKAANLGAIINSRTVGVVVPDGFSIPFAAYKKFMDDNGFTDKFAALYDDNDFVHNPKIRREKLKAFRQEIQNAKLDDKLAAEIIERWRAQLGAKPVYVRSSSNAEDLPNFSGAGLYSSVKNVKEADKILEAVKTVWASVWNFEAYEARERGFVDHTGAFMSAFVQVGIPMDNGGVMITRDPYDRENTGAVYIAAVWGHNLKITTPGEDSKETVVPEQILFSPKSNSVQVLTESAQEEKFVEDENGGLKTVALDKNRRVLTDAVARNLVRAAKNIKRLFGGVEQDIEWGVVNNRIYIIQARPYIDKKF